MRRLRNLIWIAGVYNLSILSIGYSQSEGQSDTSTRTRQAPNLQYDPRITPDLLAPPTDPFTPVPPVLPPPSESLPPIPPTIISAQPPTAEKPVGIPLKRPHLNRIGASIDFGIPDAAALGVVYRPLPDTDCFGTDHKINHSRLAPYCLGNLLRLGAAFTDNIVSPGIRGSMTFSPPVLFPILPTLEIAGGYAFSGDAQGLIRQVSGNSNFNYPTLKSLNYGYLDLLLGLDIGWSNRFIFRIQGGYSFVSTTFHDFDLTADQLAKDKGLTLIFNGRDIHAWGLVPSVRFGFIVYLW